MCVVPLHDIRRTTYYLTQSQATFCNKIVKSVWFFWQSLKAATDEGLCGDRVDDELLEAADDLYHLRIPTKWSQLGGDSSPPCTWSLAAWFTDLSNRFTHIDRMILQVLNTQHRKTRKKEKNSCTTILCANMKKYEQYVPFLP